MNKNERLAHLEATMADMVNRVKSLEETRVADDAERVGNSCDAILLGMKCGLWYGHQDAHRTVRDHIRLTWEVDK